MSKTIYWHIDDIKNLPKDDTWLSEKERNTQEHLRFAKRKSEWRLGRWVTKKALQRHLSLPLQDIEILSQENGAPHLKIKNRQQNMALSISHREQKAICAFSEQFDVIGCDLEFIEPRSDLFIHDYFTKDEIKLVQQNSQQKNLISNLIWSAKESVSKALQLGLNLDTRDVNVHTVSFFENHEWNNLEISLKNQTNFWGYWKIINNYIVTVAAREPFNKPESI